MTSQGVGAFVNGAPYRPYQIYRSANAFLISPSATSNSDYSGVPPQPPPLEIWSTESRDEYTQAMLQGFLHAEFNTRYPPLGDSASKKKSTSYGQDGGKTPEPGQQFQVVNHLISGNFDEEMLLSIPPNILNWSILTLGKERLIHLSEQLFHWMRVKGIANEHSLVKLLEAYGLYNDPIKALTAWKMVLRLQPEMAKGPRVAVALMKAYRRNNDIKGALTVLELLKAQRCQFNEYSYNVALRCCADAGHLNAAWSLLSELRSLPNVQTDVRTYSAMLDAIEASGRWPETLKVYDMIRADEIVLDAVIRAQLLKAFGRIARPDLAKKLIEDMTCEGYKPNRTHVNSLIYAYAQAGEFEKCMATYQQYFQGSHLKPDAYTYVALAHGFTNNGKGGKHHTHDSSDVPTDSIVETDIVQWTLGELKSNNVPLTVQIATALITSCRSNNNKNNSSSKSAKRTKAAQDALDIFSLMKESKIRPNIQTYNSLIATLSMCGDVESAWKIWLKCQEDSSVLPTLRTWSIMVSLCEQQGWTDKAAEFQMLRESWRELHGGR